MSAAHLQVSADRLLRLAGMSNPAAKLHELLASWTVPAAQKAETVRNWENAERGAFWRSQAQAAEYVREIDLLLGGLEASGSKVDMYRRAFPDWAAAVFAYYTPWGTTTNSPRSAVPSGSLALLDALATFIEDTDLTYELNESQQTNLREAVDNAKSQVLDDSGELPREVRRYLLGLINEAQECLEEFEAFGSVGIRSISLQLGGALVSACAALPENSTRRKRFLELASTILIPLGNLGISSANLLVTLTQAGGG